MIKKLLTSECRELEEFVIIESPFRETMRNGSFVRCVELGIAPNTFVIASQQSVKSNFSKIQSNTDKDELVTISLYPWHSVKLTIFKRSNRKSLKATFVNKCTRYFELSDMPKKKIFWGLWQTFVMELNSAKKMWPFTCLYRRSDSHHRKRSQCEKRSSDEKYQHDWTDKYLYLGSKREHEDMVRPLPVPGLGPAEELKLLHLKPRYFGCWEQSEHWVQCENISSEHIVQNKSYNG